MEVVDMIEVTRKDNSKRIVEVMTDQATNKWAFVNLTSKHICKCRFDTYNDAIKDLYNDPFVLSWKYIDEKKPKKENWFVDILGKILKITISPFR